jgi:hypothetical protein
MELETVLSSATRAVPAGVAPARVTSLTRLRAFEHLPLDVCDDLHVPPAAPHPLVSRFPATAFSRIGALMSAWVGCGMSS